MTPELKKEAALLLYNNLLSQLNSKSYPFNFGPDCSEEHKIEVRSRQLRDINKLITKINSIVTEYPSLFEL